jgi:hypothetical protein
MLGVCEEDENKCTEAEIAFNVIFISLFFVNVMCVHRRKKTELLRMHQKKN